MLEMALNSLLINVRVNISKNKNNTQLSTGKIYNICGEITNSPTLK